MPLRFVSPSTIPGKRRKQTNFIQQRRMQKVRHGADLLNSAIHNIAGLSPRFFRWFAGFLQDHFVQYHLGHGKFLPQTVMQIARDSAALLILHGHQTDGKTPQFVRSPIDHLFQFGGAVANRLFQQLTVVNVGAGSVPFNDLSFDPESERHEPETSDSSRLWTACDTRLRNLPPIQRRATSPP